MTTVNNHPKAVTVSFRQCLKGTWADRIMLFLLLLGITFLWLQIQKNLSQGIPTAYVYHGKQLLATYPLPKDDTVIHVPAQGEIGISDIEISRAGIRFVSSPCSTRHCVLSGIKQQTGSVIACVPNHIMVVLRGFEEKHGKNMHFDAITE